MMGIDIMNGVAEQALLDNRSDIVIMAALQNPETWFVL
jgi:hypothetical protein